MTLLDDVLKESQSVTPSSPTPTQDKKKKRTILDDVLEGGDPTYAPPASQPAAPVEQPKSIWQRIGDFGKRLGTNVKDLPMGVVTAVASPTLQRKQQKLEDDYYKRQNTFFKTLTGQGITDKTKRQKAYVQWLEENPPPENIIEKFNPKVMEEDYAKRVGGTFFDVATIPLAGARVGTSIVKGAAKGGAKLTAKEIAKTAGVRAVEGAAYGGARGASQQDSAKDVAIQTGAGAVLGGLVGAAEKPVSNLISRFIPKRGGASIDDVVPTKPTMAGTIQEAVAGSDTLKTVDFSDTPLYEPGTKRVTPFKTDPTTGTLQAYLPELQSDISDLMDGGKIEVKIDGKKTIFERLPNEPEEELTRRYVNEAVIPYEEQVVKSTTVGDAQKLKTAEATKTAQAIDQTAQTGKPKTNLLDDIVDEQKAARESELEAFNPPAEPKPAEVARQKLNEHVENQQLQYEAAQNTLDLANERLDGQVANLKLLIQNEERRKTGFDVTKIPGFDEYAEMLRESTNNPDLTTNDLVDYIKALPAQKDIERLKPTKLIETPTGERRVSAVEKAKPILPVTSEGQRKVPKLAQRIQEDILKNLDGVPLYNQANMADQAQKAADIIENDLSRAIRIATGKESPPKDVLMNSVYIGLEKYAQASNDVDLLRELARAGKQSTRFGQEIRALAEREESSPVKAMQSVIDARRKVFEKKFGSEADRAIKTTVTGAKQAIREALPTKEEWSSLVESIVC